MSEAGSKNPHEAAKAEAKAAKGAKKAAKRELDVGTKVSVGARSCLGSFTGRTM